MKLVIDIDEEGYIKVQDGRASVSMMRKAIRNGTPLPKGHKIIDGYALQEHLALVPMEDRTYREAVEIIDWFPSIIEADNGEADGK